MLYTLYGMYCNVSLLVRCSRLLIRPCYYQHIVYKLALGSRVMREKFDEQLRHTMIKEEPTRVHMLSGSQQSIYKSLTCRALILHEHLFLFSFNKKNFINTVRTCFTRRRKDNLIMTKLKHDIARRDF